MKRNILIGIAVLIAGFLVYVAVQPSHYLIARERTINAKPETLFPYLNNTKKTNEWMPWQDSDPSVQMTYSGPDEGVGSKASWESKGKMGVGEALVVESVPNQKVVTQITYTKPMSMVQTSEMSLTPAGEATIVRWSVTGNNTFVGRLFCVFMNMDKMVGGEFEKGLEKLDRRIREAK